MQASVWPGLYGSLQEELILASVLQFFSHFMRFYCMLNAPGTSYVSLQEKQSVTAGFNVKSEACMK